jgi:hypothetical protein
VMTAVSIDVPSAPESLRPRLTIIEGVDMSPEDMGLPGVYDLGPFESPRREGAGG